MGEKTVRKGKVIHSKVAKKNDVKIAVKAEQTKDHMASKGKKK